MAGRIVAFGEIMLRLSPPGRELLLQSQKLDVWVAGAEANVATALGRLGHDVAFVSAVPDTALGDAAIATLRGHGVDVGGVVRAPGRMGLYWVESGAGLRATEVLYDRAGSAFAGRRAEDWDWNGALEGAARFHLSGITPALGPEGSRAALLAVDAAACAGVPISFDGNYRSRLWESWQGHPRDTLTSLVGRCDVLFGNHRDVALLLDRAFDGDGPVRRRHAAEAAFDAFPNLQLIASTARHFDDVDNHRISARVDTRVVGHETIERIVPGIVDRVGTGDAFAAGVLHGLFGGATPEKMANLGLALSLFKHSVPGDAAPITPRALETFAVGGLDVRR